MYLSRVQFLMPSPVQPNDAYSMVIAINSYFQRLLDICAKVGVATTTRMWTQQEEEEVNDEDDDDDEVDGGEGTPKHYFPPADYYQQQQWLAIEH